MSPAIGGGRGFKFFSPFFLVRLKYINTHERTKELANLLTRLNLFRLFVQDKFPVACTHKTPLIVDVDAMLKCLRKGGLVSFD